MSQPDNDPLVETTAALMYDEACRCRSKKKDDPREVGSEFHTLYDEPKAFYRSLARWHLAELAKTTKVC